MWRRWLVFVAAGELIGFAVPAVVGILVRDASSGALLVAMPAAGLLEGAMLGIAQAAVLHRAWAGFKSREWVVATSLAAAFAWFLGMLPSTTHNIWSAWSTVWVVVTAAVMGTTLLASIGTAQALVLPPAARGRIAWVGWTAVGWCAGLTAFSVVAPPLWQPDQPSWLLVLIGLAGGFVMAVAMAAVTGVGAVRLVDRVRSPHREGGLTPGQHLVTSLLGMAVYDESGRRLGRVRDLVADLEPSLDRPPVTGVVVAGSGGRRLVAHVETLVERPDGDGLALSRDPEPLSVSAARPTELLLRRDVLDSPVVLADPPRRTRVNDVVVEIGSAGTSVVGVDLSASGIVRRLTRRSSRDVGPPPVPLTQVHLGSPHGHAAQLAAPESTVLTLPADEMAEILTRIPVSHARDIIHAADQGVREEAVRLLHPYVRARVIGSEGPPRRTRRLGGWRLHRPGTHPPAGDAG